MQTAMHSLCIYLLQEELLFMWMLLIAAGMCCFDAEQVLWHMKPDLILILLGCSGGVVLHSAL